MWTSPGVHPPPKAERFLQGKSIAIRQESGVIVIHTNCSEVQTGVVPGHIHVPKDNLRGRCDESQKQCLLLRPLA